jgi:hypothetical protein
MGNITLALPEELHDIVRRHGEIKWSEIARRAMWEYAMTLELLDRLAKNSKLTEEEIMALDPEIKKSIFKHYRKYVK